MATNKRTSVRLSEKLLRRTRKTLKVSTNEDALTKALKKVFSTERYTPVQKV